MAQYYKPVDIARELGISTSALRHYEAWGVVPIPERAENGYRRYTDIHLAYFRCLRSMFPSFGVNIACEVVRHLQQNKLDAALWLVNQEQYRLQQEKQSAEQALSLLEQIEIPALDHRKLTHKMTIKQVSEYTGVPASAIRHWEKMDLFTVDRDPDNGYRLFTPAHVRKILLIRSLRNSVYFLEHMKIIVDSLENDSLEKVTEVTQKAIEQLNERNRLQMFGVHRLYELCQKIGLMS